MSAAVLLFLPTVQKVRYAELASSVIIVFDHLLTLDQEVHLIWDSSWSYGKILFLVNRYYVLATVVFNNYALFTRHLSNSLCVSFISRLTPVRDTSIGLTWFQWQGWTGVITFVVAELVLQLRLYALYSLDKSVLVCMATVCLAAAASSAVVMGKVLSNIEAVAVPTPRGAVCVPLHMAEYFYAFWIPMLASESLLCGLALYRGFKAFSPGSTLFQSGRKIVGILVRDSVFYFVVIFATYLMNAIIFVARPPSEVEIPVGYAVALSCVLTSRLSLNVRGHIREESQYALGVPAHPPPQQSSNGCSQLSESTVSRAGSRRGGNPNLVVSIERGGALSVMEMHELRAMRADAKAARTL